MYHLNLGIMLIRFQTTNVNRFLAFNLLSNTHKRDICCLSEQNQSVNRRVFERRKVKGKPLNTQVTRPFFWQALTASLNTWIWSNTSSTQTADDLHAYKHTFFPKQTWTLTLLLPTSPHQRPSSIKL